MIVRDKLETGTEFRAVTISLLAYLSAVQSAPLLSMTLLLQ